MSIYDPIAEQIIHHYATDNMWGEGDGDVEAPCGYFGRLDVSNEDSARALISDWQEFFGPMVLDAKPADLIGVWLAQTDSNGNHYVTAYHPTFSPTHTAGTVLGMGFYAGTSDTEARDMDYDALVAEFSEWCEQEWQDTM